eukprot:TRINITY_DN588_c0_g1_i1.p1 TRINITY_DN588_c0_g1~~TRINITY_DN588_c0_g1_i1.p1  ORF type:complete len:215 (-),score=65.09 TRINITY_DN588_c0_g1_i1:164-766(-)
MAVNPDYDVLLKILLIGDDSGKKELLRIIVGPCEGDYISTVGVDFKVKTIIYNAKIIKLQIWDISGQHRSRTIGSSYYRGAHGIIVIYDIADIISFNNANDWLSEIERYAQEHCQKVLIGVNKCNLEENRVVNSDKAKACADSFAIPFFEVLTQNVTQVEEIFMTLLKNILLALEQRQPAPIATVAPKPTQNYNNPKKCS